MWKFTSIYWCNLKFHRPDAEVYVISITLLSLVTFYGSITLTTKIQKSIFCFNRGTFMYIEVKLLAAFLNVACFVSVSLRGKFYWHVFLSQYQSMRNSLHLYGILFPLKQSLKCVVQFETRYMNGKTSRNLCGPRGTFDGSLYTHSIAPGSAKLPPTAPLRT